MSGKSFLRVFATLEHALVAVDTILAPIVSVVNPMIGSLMTMAARAAVGVEGAITTPGSGTQRADLVSQQSGAVINVINGILIAEGKPPLPANTNDVVQAQVKTVVSGLNVVADTVDPPAK